MGRTKTLKEEYFSWLYDQVKQRRSYTKLCKELHKTKFHWSVKNDDNRYEDGLNLRQTFIEENKLDENHTEVQYFLKGDCTVFEMMVALAQRINDLMFDLSHQEDHTAKWFVELITNLGLDSYLDNIARRDGFDPFDEAEINEILEKFMDRTYTFDGMGGLFPLKRRPPKDQTNVEIWYQLMLYMDENYGL